MGLGFVRRWMLEIELRINDLQGLVIEGEKWLANNCPKMSWIFPSKRRD